MLYITLYRNIELHPDAKPVYLAVLNDRIINVVGLYGCNSTIVHIKQHALYTFIYFTASNDEDIRLDIEHKI